MKKIYSRIRQTLDSKKKADSLRTLYRLPAAHPLRFLQNGQKIINFSSNDYLDLAGDPAIAEAAAAAARELGCGSAASRLITGDLDLNRQLEETLAGLYKTESALIFPTGYMANVGILTALAGREDLILSDRLNHASIIDGIRMSGAAFRRYRHNDPEDLGTMLEKWSGGSPPIVISDTIFSMDGDLARLEEITALCEKHGAFLILDEAHANGVLGPTGLGLAEELGLLDKVDLVMGTFSKALGGLGGFVTGKKILIDYLINTARSFIFTTGLPPAVLAAALKALHISTSKPERRKRLRNTAARVRLELKKQGWDLMQSGSQIIPIRTGENSRALKLSEKLLAAGFLVMAIRPPTVPAGTARLRLSLSSGHSDQEIDALVRTMGELR